MKLLILAVERGNSGTYIEGARMTAWWIIGAQLLWRYSCVTWLCHVVAAVRARRSRRRVRCRLRWHAGVPSSFRASLIKLDFFISRRRRRRARGHGWWAAFATAHVDQDDHATDMDSEARRTRRLHELHTVSQMLATEWQWRTESKKIVSYEFLAGIRLIIIDIIFIPSLN